MSKKYILKRKILFDAFQLTEANRQKVSEWPEWVKELWYKDSTEAYSLYPEDFPDSDGTDKLKLNRSSGTITVNFNNWILRDEDNGIYCLTSEDFNDRFEIYT